MRRLVDEGSSDDAFAGAPGCGIVDVEFDGDSLDPSRWFTKNMDGDKLVGLTGSYDTPHPEETGCRQTMHRALAGQ